LKVSRFSELPNDSRQHAERVIWGALIAISPKTFAARQTIERNLEAMALKCWSNASPADFALAFKAEVDNAEKVFMQA
jgi:hypothetical protein